MRQRIFILFVVFALVIQIAASITKVEVNETDVVRLKVSATDPDNDKLIYSYSEPLDNMGEWETSYGDAGEYNIKITAFDGSLSTSQEILLIVYRKEMPPQIEKIEPDRIEVFVDEGKNAQFRVAANDLNRDELKYLWELDGKAVSESDNFLYFPWYDDAGPHKLKVSVADKKSVVVQEWKIKVADIDRIRLLDNFTDITVYENEKVKFSIPDFQSYSLNFEISYPLGNNGEWQTTYSDAGVYPVTIRIWDKNFTFEKKIRISVNNVDRLPVFPEIESLYVNENEELSKYIDINDPDGDFVKLSAENPPKNFFFSNNTLKWKPGYDAVSKSGILNNMLDKFHLLTKTYSVVIIAKSNEFIEKKTIDIAVKDVNMPFKFEDIHPITVNEGEEIAIMPQATDPDGDTISYSYSGWMTSDKHTTNYDDSGVYFVRVTASDGEYQEWKDVKITVNNINRAPVFSDSGEFNIYENSTMEIGITASDPDNDVLAISAKTLPNGAVFEDNVLRWVPGFDFSVKDAQNAEAIFTASDGELQTEQKIIIHVLNKNQQPQILNATEPLLIARINEPVVMRINAIDPDGDALSYIWKFGLFETYNATSIHQRTFSEKGEKEVVVKATDGQEDIEYKWKITVVE